MHRQGTSDANPSVWPGRTADRGPARWFSHWADIPPRRQSGSGADCQAPRQRPQPSPARQDGLGLRLQTAAIVDWMDQAGSGMAKALDEYWTAIRSVGMGERRSGERTYDMANDRDWETLAEEGIRSAAESKKISKRVRRGTAGSIRAGKPIGKPPPSRCRGRRRPGRRHRR